jgi:cellulose synthase/poly-beta-1,6-N-acetylglucosamine synthase-like glycosyltransferase
MKTLFASLKHSPFKLWELFFSVITTILLTIIFFVGSIWLYFLSYIIKSYKQSSVLESFSKAITNNFPKVSIILPTRNEE